MAEPENTPLTVAVVTTRTVGPLAPRHVVAARVLLSVLNSLAVVLPDLVYRRVVPRLLREVVPSGMGPGEVARQEVSHGLSVRFAVGDHLHQLGGEVLGYPRLVVYDKWVTAPTDIAWLAGIIDGEGSVALSHGGNRSPHLRILIYNGDPGIIDKVSRILDEIGVDWYGKWDRRAARANHSWLLGTAATLALYPLIRPHIVRQVDVLDAGFRFMQPRYEGRTRVRWTAAERAEWEGLRSRFHNVAA